MLNEKLNYWEEQKNIEMIRITAIQVWGNKVEFGEIKVLNSPYPEFEWSMWLYNQFNIKLSYDRSTLSIGIPTEEGYVVLSRLTEESVFWGFDGMKSENLLHNFQVLDRLLKKQIK